MVNDYSILEAAANNIVRKWKMKATLTDVDFKWLEKSLNPKEEEDDHGNQTI